jgi:hypothetical protein
MLVFSAAITMFMAFSLPAVSGHFRDFRLQLSAGPLNAR